MIIYVKSYRNLLSISIWMIIIISELVVLRLQFAKNVGNSSKWLIMLSKELLEVLI